MENILICSNYGSDNKDDLHVPGGSPGAWPVSNIYLLIRRLMMTGPGSLGPLVIMLLLDIIS